MSSLTEPWKNLTNAREYLEKNDVSWSTLGLTFATFLLFITLLSAVQWGAAEGAGLLLSLGLLFTLSLAGLALLIKSVQKKNEDVVVPLGRYLKYALTLLFGCVVIALTFGALGALFGNAALMFFIGNIGALAIVAYAPYKVFRLTRGQAALVFLLNLFPPVWLLGVVYLLYWWFRYSRHGKPHRKL